MDPRFAEKARKRPLGYPPALAFRSGAARRPRLFMLLLYLVAVSVVHAHVGARLWGGHVWPLFTCREWEEGEWAEALGARAEGRLS